MATSKEKFDEAIRKQMAAKNGENTKLISTERYKKLIAEGSPRPPGAPGVWFSGGGEVSKGPGCFFISPPPFFFCE